MTIYEYIKDYGQFSFEEKGINEVDCVIFSFLSYANYQKIFDHKEKMTIQEIATKYNQIHKEKDNGIIAIREGNKLLKSLRTAKRYKDCVISHYEYEGDDQIQFGAITIEYQKNKVYVSFEGTDHLFSGWKEDFMLSYQFPTASQKKAIKYLNKHFTWSNKEIIVGGHSKGGNLALVGAMYTNFLVRNKIKKIYNADGPGLLKKEFHSNSYRRIKKKYIHIIPDHSVIGLFLNHSNDKVIKSTNKTLLAHNIVYWEIKNNHFIKTELSPLSKELDKNLKEWFLKYNKTDKKEFIENLDLLLKKANITSIIELKENHKNILKLLYETKEINKKNKEILKDFIKMILSCIKQTKNEEWKEFISELFRIKKTQKN